MSRGAGGCKGGLCLQGHVSQVGTVTLAFSVGDAVITLPGELQNVSGRWRRPSEQGDGREGMCGETPGQRKARGVSPRTCVAVRGVA